MGERFTVLDQGQPKTIDVVVAGKSILFHPADLGWEVKPEGVCQEEICIPESADSDLVSEGRVNLNILARLTSRPLAVNMGEQVAYWGASAQSRVDQLSSLKAPDFTLPDLNGKSHRLSDYRGQKILLTVYGSW